MKNEKSTKIKLHVCTSYFEYFMFVMMLNMIFLVRFFFLKECRKSFEVTKALASFSGAN